MGRDGSTVGFLGGLSIRRPPPGGGGGGGATPGGGGGGGGGGPFEGCMWFWGADKHGGGGGGGRLSVLVGNEDCSDRGSVSSGDRRRSCDKEEDIVSSL